MKNGDWKKMHTVHLLDDGFGWVLLVTIRQCVFFHEWCKSLKLLLGWTIIILFTLFVGWMSGDNFGY